MREVEETFLCTYSMDLVLLFLMAKTSLMMVVHNKRNPIITFSCVCVRKFTFCQFYWKRTFILLLPKWRKLAKGGGVGTLFYYSVDCFCLRLQSCLLFQQQQRLRNTVPSFVSQKIEQCYSRESKVTQNLFFLLQLN